MNYVISSFKSLERLFEEQREEKAADRYDSFQKYIA